MSELISSPGEYAMSPEAYHADPVETPSLSSSMAKVLLNETPAHMRHASKRLNPELEDDEDGKKFALGTAAHRALMGEGVDYRVLAYDEFRSKEAKAAYQECVDAGLTPLSRKQGERVSDMVDAARDFIADSAFGLAFEKALHERVLVWRDGDVWKRAMLDALSADNLIVWDYKTTATLADPRTFPRQIANLGYDVSAAHYLDGVRAVHGVDARFIWIVQETAKPHLVSLLEPSEEMLHIGREKIARATRTFGTCLQHDAWPGYPLEAQTVDLPRWAAFQHEEAEGVAAATAHDGDPVARQIEYDRIMKAG